MVAKVVTQEEVVRRWDETHTRLGQMTDEQISREVFTLGIPGLDEHGAIRRKGVSTAAGRSGTGKTTLIEQMTLANAGKGIRLLRVSLEMTAVQHAERIARMISGGYVYTDRNGITYRDMGEAREWLGKVKDMPVDWYDEGTFNPDVLDKLLGQKSYDIVVIDYFQLMTPYPRMSKFESLSAQARQLKQIAMSNDCHILVVSQYNKSAYGKRENDDDGMMHKISGTNEVGDAADCVLHIDIIRDSMEKHQDNSMYSGTLNCEKNRHGIPWKKQIFQDVRSGRIVTI